VEVVVLPWLLWCGGETMRKKLKALSCIQKVGILFLVTAALTLLVGYLNQHGSLWLGSLTGNLLRDYYANVSAELASIAITVLIIDKLYEQRETEQEKRDLILQMGSPDNAFAVEAVRRLRIRGWLTDLQEASLSGADLTRANLKRIDLHKANLSGANLEGADLSEANLSEANLIAVNLEGAHITGADLAGANLSGANLYAVDLSDVNLSGVNLEGATVDNEQLALAKSLEGAILPDGTEYDGQIECAPPARRYLVMVTQGESKVMKFVSEYIVFSGSEVYHLVNRDVGVTVCGLAVSHPASSDIGRPDSRVYSDPPTGVRLCRRCAHNVVGVSTGK
jgi:hypothetical protein